MQPGSGSQPVPEQTVNAVASLRPFATEIQVGGEWIKVPAYPAADWLELLMGPLELFAIFPGLCSEEDQEFVEDCLAEGVVTANDVDDATLDLIETVSGRPWWITLRMVNVAETKWSVLGADMALHGVDATKLSLSGWLDVLWVTIFKHLDDKKWLMFASQIEVPPPQVEVRDSIETMEMSSDSFTALMRG